jgi:hypothetical protein
MLESESIVILKKDIVMVNFFTWKGSIWVSCVVLQETICLGGLKRYFSFECIGMVQDTRMHPEIRALFSVEGQIILLFCLFRVWSAPVQHHILRPHPDGLTAACNDLEKNEMFRSCT